MSFSNGAISTGNALLSPDVQKLITDVFSKAFTDTNTKAIQQTTDTLTPQELPTLKTASGATATPIVVVVDKTNSTAITSKDGSPTTQDFHIAGAPASQLLDASGQPSRAFAITELAGHTGDTQDADHIGGMVTFIDVNKGDNPTVSAKFDSFTYQDAAHKDISLNALQQADIKAVSVALVVIPNGGNNNNGQATWTYSVPDNAFDFLAAGETLTLTYTATVNDNFAQSPETTDLTFTITITGTNDLPVITTDKQIQAIHFSGGTGTVGGALPLVPGDPTNVTSGTFAFTDTDLTDTHTASAALTGAKLSGTTLNLQQLEALAPTPFAAFEKALSAKIVEPTEDSTGTGAGTIEWQYANLPVFLADFIPLGQTLTLDYTVTVTDSQGTTDTKIVEVTILGTNANAEVWIRTSTAGTPSTADGLWTDGKNWETGLAPVATDDVIIITDQLHALKPGDPDPIPAYPVLIDAGTQAVAHSVTMDDFSSTAPELDIAALGSLTVGTVMTLNADSILNNAGTLKLGQGGAFQGKSNITNTGLIDVQGGTLKVQVNIANAGGQVTVDPGAVLALGTDPGNSPGSGIVGSITGGSVTVGGTLDLQGNNFLTGGSLGNSGTINVTGTGNALHNETVTANHLLEVVSGALTIDQTSTVANTATQVDGGATLTLDHATITGGTVTNLANGTIDLTGSAVIQSGSLGNSGTVNSTGSNALHNETVTANHMLEVVSGDLTIDQVSTVANTATQVDGGAKLVLNDASITGGTLGNSGTLNATGGTNALHGTALTNTSTGTLESTGGVLTIDNSTTFSNAGLLEANGGELDLSNDTLSNPGTLKSTGGGVLKLISTAVTNFLGITSGNVTVDNTSTLSLKDSSIAGGTVTNNAGGTVALTGNGVLKNGHLGNAGQINVSGVGNALHNETVTANNALEILAGGVLALDQGTTVANAGGTITIDATATLTLDQATIHGGTINDFTPGSPAQGGLINVTGASKIDGISGTNAALNNGAVTVNAALTLDNVTVSGTVITDNASIELDDNVTLTGSAKIQGGPVTNLGTLEVSGAATLLNDILTNTGHTVQVDGTGVLTLDGTEIKNGTINDGNSIVVAGASKIDGISGTNAALNNGAVAGGQCGADAGQSDGERHRHHRQCQHRA